MTTNLTHSMHHNEIQENQIVSQTDKLLQSFCGLLSVSPGMSTVCDRSDLGGTPCTYKIKIYTHW